MSVFRKILITGASSGLGAAVARDLAAEGVTLVLAARRREQLEALAAELRSGGARVEPWCLDVTSTEDVLAGVRRWDEEIGGFDLVLANAGVGRAAHAAKLEWEEIERTLAVNVTGAIATLWAAMEPMLARGTGTLAGMSSVAGQRGLPRASAYSASKAALSTFLETLSVDLAQSGVRICDIRPGFVRTPMTAENRFSMPFLMNAEDAARRIRRGLERQRSVVTFPLPMAMAIGAAHHLPGWAWRWMGQRMGKRLR